MTDIEVLEREVQCVQRKAKINCTNCGNCDLLMDDSRILVAYANAISALRAQQETERNEPLTLAEAQLLIQNQEPVWRSGLTLRDASGKWKIARFCTGEYVSWQDGTHDRFENYGISWLAYRHPWV